MIDYVLTFLIGFVAGGFAEIYWLWIRDKIKK